MASCAAQASSIVFPAIWPLGEIQNLVQWVECLQLVQTGPLFLEVVAVRAVGSKMPCFFLQLIMVCSSQIIQFQMSANVVAKFWSMSLMDV